MTEETSLGERLENIPVWFYFILIILGMSVIAVTPLGLPIPVTEQTRASYQVIENLEEGDNLLINAGYSAGVLALMEPGFVVVFKHAMQRGVNIIVFSTAVAGPMLFERALEKINPEAQGYEYGKDYVHLGYVAGGEPSYAAIMSNINEVFSEDYEGTPISELPIMQEVSAPTHEKTDAIVVFTAGGDVIEGWIRQGPLRYGMPLITEVNAMMVPTIMPYYPVNLNGIINGGIGAAEYESLAGFPGEAIKLSDMLTVAGLIILIFVVLGNIGFYMRGKGGME